MAINTSSAFWCIKHCFYKAVSLCSTVSAICFSTHHPVFYTNTFAVLILAKLIQNQADSTVSNTLLTPILYTDAVTFFHIYPVLSLPHIQLAHRGWWICLSLNYSFSSAPCIPSTGQSDCAAPCRSYSPPPNFLTLTRAFLKSSAQILLQSCNRSRRCYS